MQSVFPSIQTMMAEGVLTRKESFGFALANPAADLSRVWNIPSKLIAFAYAYGPEGDYYVANAVRKLRAAARTGKDTQELRLYYPHRFANVVEKKEPDGSFEWGDFPFDGAVHVYPVGRHLLGAVSALPKEEDPVAASLITNAIGLAMWHADQANQSR
jgi:hypothetical protein